MVINWLPARITYFGKGDNRVILKPGTNVVPDEVGKVLLEDKGFKDAIAAGALRVEKIKATKEVVAEDGTAKSPVEGYDLKGIKAIVGESYDPEFLNAIVKLDKRAKAQEMAQARLDFLLEEEKKAAGTQVGEGAQSTSGEGGAA